MGEPSRQTGQRKIVNDIYEGNSEFNDPTKGHPDYGLGWRKVGTGKANPWGLYNMHGNVSEWVIDGFAKNHFAKLARIKQPVHWKTAISWPTDLYGRVAKGGNWRADAGQCRSAARQFSHVDWQQLDPQLPKSISWYTDSYNVGFRIIRPLKVPDKKERYRFWNIDKPELDLLIEHKLEFFNNVQRIEVEPYKPPKPNEKKQNSKKQPG